MSFWNSGSLKTVPYTLHRPLPVIEVLNPLKPSGYSIYHQLLKFDTSTICPHGVFMCFVRFSEQTAIISQTERFLYPRRNTMDKTCQ